MSPTVPRHPLPPILVLRHTALQSEVACTLGNPVNSAETSRPAPLPLVGTRPVLVWAVSCSPGIHLLTSAQPRTTCVGLRLRSGPSDVAQSVMGDALAAMINALSDERCSARDDLLWDDPQTLRTRRSQVMVLLHARGLGPAQRRRGCSASSRSRLARRRQGHDPEHPLC